MDVRYPPGRPNCRSGSSPARRGRCAPQRRHPRTSRRAAARSPDRPACRRYANSRPARPERRSCGAWIWPLFLRLVMCDPLAWRARFPNPPVYRRRAARCRQSHVDAHAGLQRAQLLELLALLERRRRQRDETFQRCAAISVEPDVMIKRAVARGRRGAGEIKRAQPCPARPGCRPLSPRSDRCAPPAS